MTPKALYKDNYAFANDRDNDIHIIYIKNNPKRHRNASALEREIRE